MECGLRNAENVQRVKCGFIPHEYSAFYTFAIFCVPQSAFYRCPSGNESADERIRVEMLRTFSGFGAISRLPMGIFRILKRSNHLEMVGPFQDFGQSRDRRISAATCSVYPSIAHDYERSSVWTIIWLTTDLVTCP